VACPHKGHRPGLGLTSFCPYTFSLVCILAFRTAKMPMIIWGPVLANEPLSAAFTSANSWHLKKPPKTKQSKAVFLQGRGGRRDTLLPDPHPVVTVGECNLVSSCISQHMVYRAPVPMNSWACIIRLILRLDTRGKFMVQWCFWEIPRDANPYFSVPFGAC